MIKFIGRHLLFVFMTFHLEFVFADVSEATHVLQANDIYKPTSESQITIFSYPPSFDYYVIGTIEAYGMAEMPVIQQLDVLSTLLGVNDGPGEKEDMALALRALKREAASIGANGVIIVKSMQERASENATQRRLFGAAIRYKKPPSDSASTSQTVSIGNKIKPSMEPVGFYIEASRESKLVRKLQKTDELIVDTVSGEWVRAHDKDGVYGWLMIGWVTVSQ